MNPYEIEFIDQCANKAIPLNTAWPNQPDIVFYCNLAKGHPDRHEFTVQWENADDPEGRTTTKEDMGEIADLLEHHTIWPEAPDHWPWPIDYPRRPK